MASQKKSSTERIGKGAGGTVKVKWVRRMHQVVEREDTPAVRGMIHKVRHLVEVVE
jgi:hypothetical protein